MKRTVAELIRRYGDEVTAVTRDGRRTLRAVLQPITTRSLQQMRRQFGVDGEFVRGHYLMLSPQCVADAEYLVMDGQAFCLRRQEPIRYKGSALYWWGLAEPMGEEAAWTN